MVIQVKKRLDYKKQAQMCFKFKCQKKIFFFKLSIVYCHVTNYSKTQWLQTTNIYYFSFCELGICEPLSWMVLA